jgi:NAD-dependent SIR2 family protein deacetylase
MTVDADERIAAAAGCIAQADGLIVAAGAGMGVDSGLPDFRGNEGFWRAYPALAQAGLAFTEVASPRTFVRAPALAWGFYGHRLDLYRRTVPHAGFALLQAWAQGLPHGVAVFTSNVDGQFQQAGYPEHTLYECHGSIHWLQCLNACGEPPMRADALQPDVDDATCRWRGPLPRCPQCGGLQRPGILMFGDAGWDSARYDAQAQRLQAWLRRVERPVVVELGAGTAIPSVRHFSESVALHHGGQIVRINPREWQLPAALGVGLPLGALAGLQAIDAALTLQ